MLRIRILISQYGSKTAKWMRIKMDPDPQHCPIGKVILQALHTDQCLNDAISRFLCFHTTGAVFVSSGSRFLFLLYVSWTFAFVQTYRYLIENSEIVFTCHLLCLVLQCWTNCFPSSQNGFCSFLHVQLLGSFYIDLDWLTLLMGSIRIVDEI